MAIIGALRRCKQIRIALAIPLQACRSEEAQRSPRCHIRRPPSPEFATTLSLPAGPGFERRHLRSPPSQCAPALTTARGGLGRIAHRVTAATSRARLTKPSPAAHNVRVLPAVAQDSPIRCVHIPFEGEEAGTEMLKLQILEPEVVHGVRQDPEAACMTRSAVKAPSVSQKALPADVRTREGGSSAERPARRCRRWRNPDNRSVGPPDTAPWRAASCPAVPARARERERAPSPPRPARLSKSAEAGTWPVRCGQLLDEGSTRPSGSCSPVKKPQRRNC